MKNFFQYSLVTADRRVGILIIRLQAILQSNTGNALRCSRVRVFILHRKPTENDKIINNDYSTVEGCQEGQETIDTGSAEYTRTHQEMR